MESGNEIEQSDGAASTEIVPAESYEHYTQKYNEADVANAVLSFGYDTNSRSLFIGIARFVANACESLTDTFTQDELLEFDLRVSGMSVRYRERQELLQNINDWCKSRKKLIKISNTNADKLDQNFTTATLGRFIGSLVEIANSLEFGFLQGIRRNVIDYAANVSPSLGLLTESAFILAPHLGYLGIVSCFGELFLTKAILEHVIKAIREDIQKFEPLQEWFRETDDLDASVKKLFPYGIDMNTVKTLSEVLPDLETEVMVFTSAFISNVKENPALFRDGTFASKVFLFCRSNAAKEWYKRIIKRNHPLHVESAKLNLYNELNELVRISPNSGSSMEFGRVSMKLSDAPRLLRAAMNCMTAYFSYQELRNNTKHSMSDMLRKIGKDVIPFLNVMENVRIKLSVE